VALAQKRKGQGRRALSAEVKIRLIPLPRIYRSTESRSPTHALCALTAGRQPRRWQAGPTTTRAVRRTRAQSLRRGNRGAAAGRHVRLRTSPTTRGRDA
jgi:hypothetical protein